MPDYEIAAPYNLSGRGEGLSTLMDLYKTDLKAFQDQQKEKYNRAKSTVASLIDSYHQAKSQALQQDIVNMMKAYTGVLPTALRAAVGPYIAHGPTSPMAEKTRQFKNFMGDPPKLAPLNEATGEAAEMENITKYTQYYFANEDYERQREIFMLGADAARPKATFFMFPNGKGGAMRGKDGRISFLSKQDLDFKEAEDKYGITARELIIGHGQIPTGQTGFFAKEGRLIETKEYMDYPTKTYYSKPVNVRELPKSAFYQQYPANLTKLALEWKNPNTDDDMIKNLRIRANKSKKDAAAVSAELANLFPGYNFTIITNKDPLWKSIMDWIPLVTAWVSVGQDSALIPIKGVAQQFEKGSGGMDILYYDQDLDRVYDAVGKYMGTYEQAAAIVKAR